MKHREKIQTGLFLFVENELKTRCITKGMSSEAVDAILLSARETNYIENSVQGIINEYENYYFDELTKILSSAFKKNLDELRIGENFSSLSLLLGRSHEELGSLVHNLSLIQFEEKLDLVENEIKHLEIEIKLLESHESDLIELAKIKANKISWGFATLSILSVVGWVFLVKKFGWNSMEEWTYISAIIIIAINAIYFALFEKRLTSDELKREKFESHLRRYFSIFRYNEDFLKLKKESLNSKKIECEIIKKKMTAIRDDESKK